MTREEFVRNRSWILRVIRSRCELTQTEEDYLNDLIEVLEQEPCEDCISRAEAIKALNCEISGSIESDIDLSKYKREFQEFANIILNAQEKAIQALPPVTPKPKTGHWISKHIVDDCNGVVLWYECSECGRSVDAPITEEFMLKDYPYCHCGAKMLPTDLESGDDKE